MSIRDDFRMYYRGTYIGVRKDGVVIPFYVDEVDGGGRDWSETSKNSLVFHGRFVEDDEVQLGRVTMSSGNVILELPELGYIEYRGINLWLRYRPQHVASKGLSSRRVTGIMSLNDDIARSIFKAVRVQPNHTARQFAFSNGEVLYKNRVIGTYSDEHVRLNDQARFLVPVFAKAFPEKVLG